MRYNIKVPKPKPVVVKEVKIPEVGDTKQVIKFAFLPTKINKTCGVWLEKYIEIWEYKTFRKRVPINQYSNEYIDHPIMGIGDYSMKVTEWRLKEKHIYI